jgi:hypothetical protein
MQLEHSIEALVHVKNQRFVISEVIYSLDFMLLWSLFEANARNANYFKKSLNLKAIINVIDASEPTFEKKKIDEYFKKIVKFEIIENPTKGILFLENYSNPIDLHIAQDFVNPNFKKRVFSDCECVTNKDKLILLGYICYRIRNNLFHGNKDLTDLWQQKSIFEIINPFLKELIIFMHDDEIRKEL